LTALNLPVNGREFGTAIPAAFRRRRFQKPNQYECTKRHHRHAAGHDHFDVVAVGVLEPFAHLSLPAGITAIIMSTRWLAGLQFVH
jgi:hypothetical protein